MDENEIYNGWSCLEDDDELRMWGKGTKVLEVSMDENTYRYDIFMYSIINHDIISHYENHRLHRLEALNIMYRLLEEN